MAPRRAGMQLLPGMPHHHVRGPRDYDARGAPADRPRGRPRALGRRRARLRPPRRRARAARARRADRPRRRHQHGRHPRRRRRRGLDATRNSSSASGAASSRRIRSRTTRCRSSRWSPGRKVGQLLRTRARRHRHRGPAAAVLLRLVEPDDRTHRRAPAGTAVALAARLGRDPGRAAAGLPRRRGVRRRRRR